MPTNTMLIANQTWSDVDPVSSTSSSSHSIGTGSKTFTVAAGSAFYVGQTVTITKDASNYMSGPVTAWSGTSLTVNVTATTGSGGPYTSWTIEAAKWTGGSWESALPLANLETDLLFEVARSTDETTASTKFMVDMATPSVIDFVAMINSNLTINAAIRVRLMDVSTAGAFSTIYDSGLVDVFDSVEAYGILPWGLFSWGGLPDFDGQRPPILHFTREMSSTTSSSSVAVGTGNKTFTVASTTGLGIGARVSVSSDANPFNSMAGSITGITGSNITVNVTVSEGSGTHTDWTVRWLTEDGERQDYTARFLVVDISDTGNEDGYIDIGRLLVTKSYQPPYNMEYGWSIEWVDNSRKSRSRGGQLYSDELSKYRRVVLTLSFLERDDALGVLYEIDREMGTTRPMLLCLDPDDTTHLHRLTLYCVSERLQPIANPFFERYARQFQFEEF